MECLQLVLLPQFMLYQLIPVMKEITKLFMQIIVITPAHQQSALPMNINITTTYPPWQMLLLACMHCTQTCMFINSVEKRRQNSHLTIHHQAFLQTISLILVRAVFCQRAVFCLQMQLHETDFLGFQLVMCLNGFVIKSPTQL